MEKCLEAWKRRLFYQPLDVLVVFGVCFPVYQHGESFIEGHRRVRFRRVELLLVATGEFREAHLTQFADVFTGHRLRPRNKLRYVRRHGWQHSP